MTIQNEAKVVRDMADRLTVEQETNVLFREAGATLDPAILFGEAFDVVTFESR